MKLKAATYVLALAGIGYGAVQLLQPVKKVHAEECKPCSSSAECGGGGRVCCDTGNGNPMCQDSGYC